MRAVWSFWSKPFASQRRMVWGDGVIGERRHKLAWVLSVMLARQHYPNTELVTDDAGARLLVDELGLPFSHVSTALNDLAQANPQWWSLGKLYAFGLQASPFVHLDNDVFLWKRLPKTLEQAEAFAQHPYSFSQDHLKRVAARATHIANSWLPAELNWYANAETPTLGAAAGIVGGCHIDFIRHYAHAALKLLAHVPNRAVWGQFPDTLLNLIMAEECLLAACAAFHSQRSGSPFNGVQLRFLFASHAAAFDRNEQVQAGYTHCCGDQKQQPILAARIEQRVREDYPTWYARC
jgi:hypothetical protein